MILIAINHASKLGNGSSPSWTLRWQHLWPTGLEPKPPRDPGLRRQTHRNCERITSNLLHSNRKIIIEKERELFQKNYFCFIDYLIPLTVWIKTNWKILQELGLPDNLTCLLRNLGAGQEATVRIRHGTRLVPNWERSTSRLYTINLLI